MSDPFVKGLNNTLAKLQEMCLDTANRLDEIASWNPGITTTRELCEEIPVFKEVLIEQTEIVTRMLKINEAITDWSEKNGEHPFK